MPQNGSGPPVAPERAAKSKTSEKQFTRRAPSVQEGFGQIENARVLIPAGRYQLQLSHWWTGVLFGRRPKLALIFKVVDFGEHFGVLLERWYNVTLPRHLATGRNGSFKAGWSSDLVREYVSLIGIVKRNDRIALSKYADAIVNAEIVTVSSTSKQEPLPEALHYSVIRKLLSVEARREERLEP